MGMTLGPDDWAIRCNLMTISDGRLTDFTAGHITNEEGRTLIEAIQAGAGAARRRVPCRGQLSQPHDLSRAARTSLRRGSRIRRSPIRRTIIPTSRPTSTCRVGRGRTCSRH